MKGDLDSRAQIRAGLERVADVLDGVEFRLPTTERDRLERERRAISTVVRDYLLPRLQQPEAPVVAAIVGASGSGKSTLVNALAQDRISHTGPVRPTTIGPILWGHRDHAGWYTSALIPRLRSRTGHSVEMIVGTDELTRNLTLIDTPPLDLSRSSSAPIAADVLALADLCVFVTTAGRYADAAGWEFVGEAQARGVPLLFVLNRLGSDPDIQNDLLTDFAGRLSLKGFLASGDPAFVFGVPETKIVGWHKGLEPGEVAMLRKELSELSDPDFRAALLDQVTVTTGQELGVRLRLISSALRDENRHLHVLWNYAEQSYSLQEAKLRGELEAGSFAPLADLDTWSQAAVDLTGVVTRRAGVAAQDAAAAWFEDPVGEALLASGGQGLWRHAHDTTYDTQRALETWGAGLEDLVGTYARRTRLSQRAKRRFAAKLWPLSLDPGREARAGRLLGDRSDEFVATARETLSEALGLSLRADLARFSAALGGLPGDEAIAELDALERIVTLGPGESNRAALDSTEPVADRLGGSDLPSTEAADAAS